MTKIKQVFDQIYDRVNTSGKNLYEPACELAQVILEDALAEITKAEQKDQDKIGGMVADPAGKALTVDLTDRCFRTQNNILIADQIVKLLKSRGIPKYFPFLDRILLSLFVAFAPLFPNLLVPLFVKKMRQETEKVVLPGESGPLSSHLGSRYKSGYGMNLNQIGEAVMGQDEAEQRVKKYIKTLENPLINTISVKISTIYSQINLVAYDQSKADIMDALSRIYRAAKANKDKNGNYKFVNLDMEEYRDLYLTFDCFTSCLDLPEFKDLTAGIVLQAYIPDSFSIQKRLTEWAIKRTEGGGAFIKTRIVKGANLMMEKIDASLFDLPQTPYDTKVEVDANFKRMVVYALENERFKSVKVGVGSHNIFDISFTLLKARIENASEFIVIEMLEGIADHFRRSIKKLDVDILLYAPVAAKEDFLYSIGYLIRRLDENTGEENFLRYSFGLRPGNKEFVKLKESFIESARMLSDLRTGPKRLQDRNIVLPEEERERIKVLQDESFINESDTDFSLPQNQRWSKAVAKEYSDLDKVIENPYIIAGQEKESSDFRINEDPSIPGKKITKTYLASKDDIDLAIETANKDPQTWSKMPLSTRKEYFSKIAFNIRQRRKEFIAVMMLEAAKIIEEGDKEVSEAIDFAEFYIRSLEQHFDEIADFGCRPKGTVLVISPWNFPFAIAAGGILSALCSGNRVILKPSPETPLTGNLLAQCFWDAGISKETLQLIHCSNEPEASYLASHAGIAAIVFTGSTAVARKIRMARTDVDFYAETGGKNATIISALSDRDLAIKNLRHSAFSHNGQKCSATSLLLLEEEVFNDSAFMSSMLDAVSSYPVGGVWDLKNKITPLIRPPSGMLLRGLNELHGDERWLLEPRIDDNNPRLVYPGIKLGTQFGCLCHKEEFFGPLLTILPYTNLDQAIDIVNSSGYGLTSGIESLSESEIENWKEKISAGNLYINRGTTGAVVKRQPFGGYGRSNFGPGAKAGGNNYVLQFVEPVNNRRSRDKIESISDSFPKTLLDKYQLRGDENENSFFSDAKKLIEEHFQAMDDPMAIRGQFNLQRYRPRKDLLLRLESESKIDFLKRALLICELIGIVPHLSIEPSLSSIENQPWLRHLKTVSVDKLPAFCELLSNNSFDAAFLFSEGDESRMVDYQLAALENCVWISYYNRSDFPKIELLRFFKEQSISFDFHRYGNLGRYGLSDKPQFDSAS